MQYHLGSRFRITEPEEVVAMVMRCFLAPILVTGCLAAADPQWITDAGGVVLRDKAGPVTCGELRSSSFTDYDLAEVAKIPSLKSGDLRMSRVTYRGLLALRPAAHMIESVNLYFAEL